MTSLKRTERKIFKNNGLIFKNQKFENGLKDFILFRVFAARLKLYSGHNNLLQTAFLHSKKVTI